MSIMNFTQAQLTSLISAINARAKLASPAFTGTPSLPTGTTAVTQTAGDNSTKISTTAFVKAQGYLTSALQDTAHSFAANGYQKLSNGLIIQWGQTTSGTSNATFPIAFPNACLQATTSIGSNSGDIGTGKITIVTLSTTGFTMYASQTNIWNRYIAIGY